MAPFGEFVAPRGIELRATQRFRIFGRKGLRHGSTALAFVVRQGPGFYERKRPILQALLEAGAAPNPKLYPGSSYTAITFCAEALPGCQNALLPLLNTYAVRRGLPPADIPK